MNFKKWLLHEMPITSFNKVGDWGEDDPKRGWDKPSIGILNNERGVQKIIDAWKNSPVDFDLYFVKQKGAWMQKFEGEVTEQWVKENLNLDIKPRGNSISVIFTQNQGGLTVPMTAWIIAHRLGHALEAGSRRSQMFSKGSSPGTYSYMEAQIRQDFIYLLEEVFGIEKPYSGFNTTGRGSDIDKWMLKLMSAVGTMKSARNNKVANTAEFIHELFAQTIINGKVKFGSFPKQLVAKYAWGRPSDARYSSARDDDIYQADLDSRLEAMADHYTHMVNQVLKEAVGRMFSF